MSHPDPIPTASVSALRVPPFSAEAEQSVLGGILLSPDRLHEVNEVLNDEDFFRRENELNDQLAEKVLSLCASLA